MYLEGASNCTSLQQFLYVLVSQVLCSFKFLDQNFVCIHHFPHALQVSSISSSVIITFSKDRITLQLKAAKQALLIQNCCTAWKLNPRPIIYAMTVCIS